MAIHTHVRRVQEDPGAVHCDLCKAEPTMYEHKGSEPVVRDELPGGGVQDQWVDHQWFLGPVCSELVAAKEDAELYERIEDHNPDHAVANLAALTAWRETLAPSRRRLLP